MLKKTFYLTLLCTLLLQFTAFAQVASTDTINNTKSPVVNLPVIDYTTTPKKYTIADIRVSGVENSMYADQSFVLINFSGLAKGQTITVPGDEITKALERFWKQGLFSDIKILADKIEGDKIWLEIRLTDRPRVAEIQYTGMKKSEREDIDKKIGVVKGNQITPNQVNTAKTIIKKYFAEKGFGEAEVNIRQTPDGSNKNMVILGINVDKKEKIGVSKIEIEGNKAISDNKLKWAMKKTNEKKRLINLFRTKKFVQENYEEDKKNVINKYHELGYRDAEIISDTVYKHDDKTVGIKMKVEEGTLYHIRNINWVGNTVYNTYDLARWLNMKSGDVYNQKKLNNRLSTDEDAVINQYQNNGYLFSRIEPVEVNIEKDSVDLELRVVEGPKATINRVTISGNDRLYEDVIRRELRVKPGAVYSKEDIIRSMRELAQAGHFDPEALSKDIQVNPHPEGGTVDIGFPLVSKGNDQIEFSAGWGVTGLVGKLSLKLNNFSLENLLHPDKYKGIIPQGEGQTLVLSGQTNGKYFQSYQVSFTEPWFGGARPNNFSVSAYYSRYTGMNSNYLYNNNYYNPYYGYGGGYNPYGGYGGYGGGYGYGADMTAYAADPDKVFEMMGASIGYGKRLNWPDDYFMLQAELAYQRYNLKNWQGFQQFPFLTGASNSVSLNITFARNSIDNPAYTRIGSQFSLNASFTPPFSLFDGIDYSKFTRDQFGYESASKYKWNEFHKWKFKVRTYTPLTSLTVKRTPVLATRAEFGMVGYYNINKQTPFETFDVGGSGMSGYSSSFATETIALRGYSDNSVATGAHAYTRFGLEFRYPFILEPNSTIYGLAFLEAGNAWRQVKDINPFQLRKSAGVGARVLLPMIGLLGIDWGYGFDRDATGRKGGSQLHFVLGQEF